MRAGVQMNARFSRSACCVGSLLMFATACGQRSVLVDAMSGSDAARDDGLAVDDGPSDSPGDAPSDASTWIVPPLTSCHPTGDACTAPTSSAPTLHAAYRKDAYLSGYAESGAAPTTGGRIQVAAIAQVTGTVASVVIDGVDAESIYTEHPSGTPPLEWYQVWPRNVVAGQPVWVAFHSRAAAWDSKSTATLRVTTSSGAAVDGTFALTKPSVPVTYVTTTDDLKATIIHVKNTSNTPQTLTALEVDGREVFAAGIACVPSPTLAPGVEAVWTVPSCAPLAPGAASTVIATWQGAPESVAVGRVLRPAFPIEAWQNTSECAFPGGNAQNDQRLRSAAIDTIYVHGGMCGTCGCTTRTLLTQTLPAQPDRFALVTPDTVLVTPPLASTVALRGVSTGDESDGEIYDASTGVPNAANRAQVSRRVWEAYPELTTFNGAKTNKNVGTFAGMTDVQGIDLYVAACAPHITMFGSPPPLRGAYDYLRNARNNHMPAPTWLYSQGLHAGWNKSVLSQTIHVQPDPQELWVQAISVIAAGGKGLLWFQVDANEATSVPARWKAIADASHVTRAVRSLLRRGDPTGMLTVDADTLAESIRAPEALVVPVIGLKTSSTVDDVACTTVVSAQSVPHWKLADHSSPLRLTIPDDLGVADVFEVTPAGVVNAPAYVVQGRELVFSSIALSNATPARVFVVAASPALRAQIAAALVP